MTDLKACLTPKTFESVHVAADLGLPKRRCPVILQCGHAIVSRAKIQDCHLHMFVKQHKHVQM